MRLPVRLPDVVPAPYPVGHARDEEFEGAVLACSPDRLPDNF